MPADRERPLKNAPFCPIPVPAPCNVYPVKRGALFNQGEAYFTGVRRSGSLDQVSVA